MKIQPAFQGLNQCLFSVFVLYFSVIRLPSVIKKMLHRTKYSDGRCFLKITKLIIMENQSKNQKSKSVKAVPEGMHSVTPYLVVDGANDLIRFIEQSFGGKTMSIMKTKDGRV